MDKKCYSCGALLRSGNKGVVCSPCKERVPRLRKSLGASAHNLTSQAIDGLNRYYAMKRSKTA